MAKTIKIIAKNSFHNTEAHLSVRGTHGGTISPARVKKLRKELCSPDCTCFVDHTQYFEHFPGYRNSENRQIRLAAQEMPDGGIFVEVI